MNIDRPDLADCPYRRLADQRPSGIAAPLPDTTPTRRRVHAIGHAERAGWRGSPRVLVNRVDAFADAAAGTTSPDARRATPPPAPAGGKSEARTTGKGY
jgi:hypothetical protein